MMQIQMKQNAWTRHARGFVPRWALALGMGAGVLVLGVQLGGCADKPPEVKVALGAVTRIQFTSAGWSSRTQIDAAGRSVIVRESAPMPVNTSVELRGSRQHAQQLCVSGSERCWLIDQPEQHDWALLGLKP